MSHSENAHAARVGDGIVREVIVIPYCNDNDNEITAYCNGLGLSGTWMNACTWVLVVVVTQVSASLTTLTWTSSSLPSWRRLRKPHDR